MLDGGILGVQESLPWQEAFILNILPFTSQELYSSCNFVIAPHSFFLRITIRNRATKLP